ncbi:ABC transporter permease subunit [Atopobacter sp. AH10]|uniref:ABC transporter permease n=1 Tax=Atopobacter sp. AH10 TaxID=2315861 RepID=UPI000EF1F8FA|nr:ABC transporter permease subunit [Atopobacter sp. AH10]RLK63346.1 ABC transporter permease subunit [Atopobacter sp. AH10]
MTVKRCVYGTVWLIFAWFIVAILYKNECLPQPFTVLTYLFTQQIIWKHFGMTCLRLLLASFISYTLGSLMALWMATSYRARRYLLPIGQTLYDLPRIAFFPLFYLFIKNPFIAQLLVLVFVSIFYVGMPLYESLVELPERYFWIARSLDFSTGMWVKRVAFPAVLPRLIFMARQLVGMTLMIIFVTENYRTHLGIGKYLLQSYVKGQYKGLYAALLLILSLNAIIALMIEWIKQRNMEWLTPLSPFSWRMKKKEK